MSNLIFTKVEQSVDWPKFREDAAAPLKSYGSKFYIKEDLQRAV